MKRKQYSKIIITLLLIGISNSVFYPCDSWAAVYPKLTYTLSQKNDSDFLGPKGFKAIYSRTSSSMFVMESYAKKITNQSETALSSLSTIDTALRAAIVSHQKVAKVNANNWLDDMKPQVLETNQNIISFNDTFQNYYKRLSTAIEHNNKEQLQADLEVLYTLISHHKQEADLLTKKPKIPKRKSQRIHVILNLISIHSLRF